MPPNSDVSADMLWGTDLLSFERCGKEKNRVFGPRGFAEEVLSQWWEGVSKYERDTGARCASESVRKGHGCKLRL